MRCGARLTCLTLDGCGGVGRGGGGVGPGPEHGLIVICRYHELGGSGTDNGNGNQPEAPKAMVVMLIRGLAARLADGCAGC